MTETEARRAGFRILAGPYGSTQAGMLGAVCADLERGGIEYAVVPATGYHAGRTLTPPVNVWRTGAGFLEVPNE